MPAHNRNEQSKVRHAKQRARRSFFTEILPGVFTFAFVWLRKPFNLLDGRLYEMGSGLAMLSNFCAKDISAPKTSRTWLRTFLIATALFAFVVLGRLEFAFGFADTALWGLFCFAVFIALFVAILLSAVRKRWVACLCSAFVLLACIAAFYTGGLIQHNQVEQSKKVAEPVIAALEVYKTEHGRYPDQLQALVPGYLDAIPTLRLGPLRYYTYDEDQFILLFRGFAFLDAMYYSSDTGTWVWDAD